MQPKSIAEYVGWAAGMALAPLVVLGTWLRQGRLAHPVGVVCAAEVTPLEQQDPRLAELASRLAGGALIRFSGGFWKRLEAPEPLGCAIRFRGPRPLVTPASPGDQDLIAATFSLDSHDYLRRPYYVRGSFDADGLDSLSLRIMPEEPNEPGRGSRNARLLRAIDTDRAVLRLEVRPSIDRQAPWQPLCELQLRGLLDLDQRELDFSPWRAGLGLRPRGALNAARAVVYRASQTARQLAHA